MAAETRHVYTSVLRAMHYSVVQSTRSVKWEHPADYTARARCNPSEGTIRTISPSLFGSARMLGHQPELEVLISNRGIEFLAEALGELVDTNERDDVGEVLQAVGR